MTTAKNLMCYIDLYQEYKELSKHKMIDLEKTMMVQLMMNSISFKKAEVILSQQMGLTLYQFQRLNRIKADRIIARIEYWEELTDMEPLFSINLKAISCSFFISHHRCILYSQDCFQTSCNNLPSFMK